jgi:hypothetical protein
MVGREGIAWKLYAILIAVLRAPLNIAVEIVSGVCAAPCQHSKKFTKIFLRFGKVPVR